MEPIQIKSSLTEEEKAEIVTIALEQARERAKMLYVRRRQGHGSVAEAFDKGFEAALEFAHRRL
jgi:hypothetical protein